MRNSISSILKIAVIIVIFIGCNTSRYYVGCKYDNWLSYWEKRLPTTNTNKIGKFVNEAKDIIILLINQINEVDKSGTVTRANEINNALPDFYKQINQLQEGVDKSISTSINIDSLKSYNVFSIYLPLVVESRVFFNKKDFENCLTSINKCDLTNSKIKLRRENYILYALDFFKDTIITSEIKGDLFKETEYIVRFRLFENIAEIDFSYYQFQQSSGEIILFDEFLNTKQNKCYKTLVSKINNYIKSENYYDANNHLKYAKRLVTIEDQPELDSLEYDIFISGFKHYQDQASELMNKNRYEEALSALNNALSIDPNNEFIKNEIGKLYFKWGKYFYLNKPNYKGAIEKLREAKKWLKKPTDADDLILAIYTTWGHEKLTDAEKALDRARTKSDNLLKHETCKVAYFLADSAIILINLGNSSATDAKNIKDEAKKCATQHIYINIDNQTKYDLNAYNSDLNVLLSNEFEKINKENKNIFLQLTDNLINTDYILNINILKSYLSSPTSYSEKLTYCKYVTLDGVWFTYYEAPVTRYVQDRSGNLDVSLILKCVSTNQPIKQIVSNISNSWHNEYLRSNVDKDQICKCPENIYYGKPYEINPYIYDYNKAFYREKDYLFSSSNMSPPGIESLLHNELQKQLISSIWQFKNELYKL